MPTFLRELNSLFTNLNADSGGSSTGWVNNVASWDSDASDFGRVPLGSTNFWNGQASTNYGEATQRINLSDASVATELAAGQLLVRVEFWRAGWTGDFYDLDASQIVVRGLAGGTAEYVTTVGGSDIQTAFNWTNCVFWVPVPPDTEQLEIRLRYKRNSGGSAQSYVEDITVDLYTTDEVSEWIGNLPADAGAWTVSEGTATPTATTASPFSDFEVVRPASITGDVVRMYADVTVPAALEGTVDAGESEMMFAGVGVDTDGASTSDKSDLEFEFLDGTSTSLGSHRVLGHEMVCGDRGFAQDVTSRFPIPASTRTIRCTQIFRIKGADTDAEQGFSGSLLLITPESTSTERLTLDAVVDVQTAYVPAGTSQQTITFPKLAGKPVRFVKAVAVPHSIGGGFGGESSGGAGMSIGQAVDVTSQDYSNYENVAYGTYRNDGYTTQADEFSTGLFLHVYHDSWNDVKDDWRLELGDGEATLVLDGTDVSDQAFSLVMIAFGGPDVDVFLDRSAYAADATAAAGYSPPFACDFASVVGQYVGALDGGAGNASYAAFFGFGGRGPLNSTAFNIGGRLLNSAALGWMPWGFGSAAGQSPFYHSVSQSGWKWTGINAEDDLEVTAAYVGTGQRLRSRSVLVEEPQVAGTVEVTGLGFVPRAVYATAVTRDTRFHEDDNHFQDGGSWIDAMSIGVAGDGVQGCVGHVTVDQDGAIKNYSSGALVHLLTDTDSTDDVDISARLTAWGSDGFTLTFDAVGGVSDPRYIYLTVIGEDEGLTTGAEPEVSYPLDISDQWENLNADAGDTSGWNSHETISLWGSQTSTVHKSTAAWGPAGSASDFLAMWQGATLPSDVDLSPGDKRARVSFYISGFTNDTDQDVGMVVLQAVSGGTAPYILSEGSSGWATTYDSQFHYVEFSLPLPPETEELRIGLLGVKNAGSFTNVYIDDIQVFIEESGERVEAVRTIPDATEAWTLVEGSGTISANTFDATSFPFARRFIKNEQMDGSASTWRRYQNDVSIPASLESDVDAGGSDLLVQYKYGALFANDAADLEIDFLDVSDAVLRSDSVFGDVVPSPGSAFYSGEKRMRVPSGTRTIRLTQVGYYLAGTNTDAWVDGQLLLATPEATSGDSSEKDAEVGVGFLSKPDDGASVGTEYTMTFPELAGKDVKAVYLVGAAYLNADGDLGKDVDVVRTFSSFVVDRSSDIPYGADYRHGGVTASCWMDPPADNQRRRLGNLADVEIVHEFTGGSENFDVVFGTGEIKLKVADRTSVLGVSFFGIAFAGNDVDAYLFNPGRIAADETPSMVGIPTPFELDLAAFIYSGDELNSTDTGLVSWFTALAGRANTLATSFSTNPFNPPTSLNASLLASPYWKVFDAAVRPYLDSSPHWMTSTSLSTDNIGAGGITTGGKMRTRLIMVEEPQTDGEVVTVDGLGFVPKALYIGASLTENRVWDATDSPNAAALPFAVSVGFKGANVEGSVQISMADDADFTPKMSTSGAAVHLRGGAVGSDDVLVQARVTSLDTDGFHMTWDAVQGDSTPTWAYVLAIGYPEEEAAEPEPTPPSLVVRTRPVVVIMSG